MRDIDLFSFSNYRTYLRVAFEGKGELRGRRILLAEALRCQTSFLSQVLTDRAHLSLEYAIKTSEFLGHNEVESRYFMLLVQKGKAGSVQLEKHFEKQLLEIKKRREEIKERLQDVSDLTPEDQMRYYSAWYYSAIHILVALPGLNTQSAIINRLKLPTLLVKDVCEFLESRGFIQHKAGVYEIGSRMIHLTRDSPMLARHHANWRMRAIDAVDSKQEENLHYSAILGISKADQKVFREKLLKLIEDFEPIVRDSKEEVPVIMLMDLFGI